MPEIENRSDTNNIPEMDEETRKRLSDQRQRTSLEGDDSKEEYLLFVWDFGGQTEYYATHHLFLEAEAAYLIVMDITKPFDKPVDCSNIHMIQTTPTTPEEFLHY